MRHIVLESLRLYPPTKSIYRLAKVGTNDSRNEIITVNILSLHRDPNIWGPSSLLLNPHCFENPTKKDKKLRQDAFMAFGSRPHVCPAGNIAPVLIGMVVAALLKEVGSRRIMAGSLEDKDIHSSEPLRLYRDAYGSLRFLRRDE